MTRAATPATPPRQVALPIAVAGPVVPGRTVVLSFDPGWAALGYSLLVFTPGRQRVAMRHRFLPEHATPRERYGELAEAVWESFEVAIAGEHAPDVVAVEAVGGVFTGKDREGSSARGHDTRRLLEVVGMVRAAARWHHVPVIDVHPQTAKIALLGKGSRSATKKQMVEGVERVFGIKVSQDVADSIAIGVAGRRIFELERRGLRPTRATRRKR